MYSRQIFKNAPLFTNLQPAVNRQPGYRRGDSQSIIDIFKSSFFRKFSSKFSIKFCINFSNRVPRKSIQTSKYDHTIILEPFQIIFLTFKNFRFLHHFSTSDDRLSTYGFPQLELIEEQTLLHAPPQTSNLDRKNLKSGCYSQENSKSSKNSPTCITALIDSGQRGVKHSPFEIKYS